MGERPQVALNALWIEAGMTVEGPDTIDAKGHGHAVYVVVHEAEVVLRKLTLTRGHGELGGGLRVDGWSSVLVEDCVFEGNVGAQGGANGAGVSAGKVTFVRCRFGPKEDLLLTGACEVELVDCDVSAGIRVREGARVKLVGGRVGGTLDLAGTTTRAPRVEIVGTDVAAVHNDDQLPGELVRS